MIGVCPAQCAHQNAICSASSSFSPPARSRHASQNFLWHDRTPIFRSDVTRQNTSSCGAFFSLHAWQLARTSPPPPLLPPSTPALLPPALPLPPIVCAVTAAAAAAVKAAAVAAATVTLVPAGASRYADEGQNEDEDEDKDEDEAEAGLKSSALSAETEAEAAVAAAEGVCDDDGW